MTPEQLERVAQLYQATLELKPSERAALLDQACGEDEALRREVESLLAADEQAEGFLVAGAMNDAAKMLVEHQSFSLVGRRLGHYQVLSPLGAGGMGEVYLAEDTKLGRKVAVKLLPAQFTQDAERVRRFEREARAASALNHPNIMTVHEIDEEDGAYFIVTEFIEGQTLRQQMQQSRLARLTLRAAIEVATQVASALAAAHAAGIVHRDIKPENIMVRPDGLVKVLDFGLAKLTELRIVDCGLRNEEAEILRQSPPNNPQSAIHNPQLTGPGAVMGTVGYMSPEQVQGQDADHRSDLFALGSVLYEMLAGRRAFEGASAAEVMSAILRDEPEELQEINDQVPPPLGRIVRRCLEKRPEQRFQSASDLSFALAALSAATLTPSGSRLKTSAALAGVTKSVGRWRLLGNALLAWVAAGICLMAALLLAVGYLPRAPGRQRPIHATIPPPEQANFFPTSAQMAVSPDGLRLVFVARGADGKRLLWVRPLDASAAQPLIGTDGATHPFWSPESRFVGFFADGKLKKIDAAGGPPQTLCEAPVGAGGTWSRQGVILFRPTNFGPLHRVSAAGGASSAVTKLDASRRETDHH